MPFYGKHKLTVVRHLGTVTNPDGRQYRVVDVVTQDGLEYRAVRLYNAAGHFIKQFLMEPQAVREVARLLYYRQSAAERFRKGRMLLSARNLAILAAFEGGKSMAAIGEDYRLSRQAVWSIITRIRRRRAEPRPTVEGG